MRQPISKPSPFAHLSDRQKDLAFLSKLMVDLQEMHKKFIDGLKDYEGRISKLRGPKGDKPSQQEIAAAIRELIPIAVRQEIIAEVLSHVRQPKDGYTPTSEELNELIAGQMPEQLSEEDVLRIVRPLLPDVSNVHAGIEDKIDVDKIMERVKKGKKLSMKDIDGLEQTMHAFSSQLSKGYLHGGGDTVKAGSNITLTRNSDGSTTIAASGGGSASVIEEDLTGTQSGNAVTATLAHTPVSFLGAFKNGQKLRVGIGYSRSGTGVTFFNSDASTDYFEAIYTY